MLPEKVGGGSGVGALVGFIVGVAIPTVRSAVMNGLTAQGYLAACNVEQGGLPPMIP